MTISNRDTGTGRRTNLDLFIRRDSTEDDLGEALGGKHAVTDASDDVVTLDEGETLVLPAYNEYASKPIYSTV